MSMEWKHRGRIITLDDIRFIQDLIDANPQVSRRQLSAKLCEAWQWKQANGALRDMVCRGLLLKLDRGGQIQLPPIKKRPNNPLARRPKPAPLLIDRGPIQGSLSELQPIHIQQVRRTGDESLYNSLIEQHHYLGYEQPVGEHLKYVVWPQDGRSPVWPGVPHRDIWAAGIDSSDGAGRRVGATSDSLPITRVF